MRIQPNYVKSGGWNKFSVHIYPKIDVCVQQYENVKFYQKFTNAFYCKLHTFGNELSSTQDSLQQSA